MTSTTTSPARPTSRSSSRRRRPGRDRHRDRAGRPAHAGPRRDRRERRAPRASTPTSASARPRCSWVLNAYTLAFGGLLLLGGRLGDVRGRLPVFEVGLAVFTLASLLGGLAPTPAAGRRPRPPGRRRRAGRSQRARPAHHQRPRRGRPATARWPSSAPSPRAAPRSACCSAAASPTSARGAGRCSSTCRSGSPCWLLAPRFVDETPRRPGRFDIVGAVTATARRRRRSSGRSSARPSTAGPRPAPSAGFVVGLALLVAPGRDRAPASRTR